MMHVKASDGPQGPRIQVTSADRKIAELSEQLSALGIAHVYDFQTDYRSCLTITMQDGRKREEAEAKL